MFWSDKKTIAVHSGNFHSDDVFSVAVLSILFNGKIKVIRTRDPQAYAKADFWVDVGLEYDPEKNRFDHHQVEGAGIRPNGIKYSSVGILWKKYGAEVCGSEKVAKVIDERIIQTIDADDDGKELCTPILSGIRPFYFTDFIYDLTPSWKESNVTLDDAFMNAVSYTKNILEREIKSERDEEEAESVIEKIYNESKDKRIIVLENPFLPKSVLLKYSEPAFVVKPEKDGKYWRVTGLNKERYKHELRKNFPESWWGRRDGELSQISGVNDATFCRNGGVFAGAKTKEGAIKMAELALSK